jgi:hypothetical protein
VAELEVERGVDVVVVVAAEVPEELDAPAVVVDVPPDEPDEPDAPDASAPDPDADVVEVLRVVPTVAAPGISFDTTRPSAAAPPTATITTDLDMRRTRAVATSRRLAPGPPERAALSSGRLVAPARLVRLVMRGMSPCEPRGPRTVG